MAVTTIKSATSNNTVEVDSSGQLFTRTTIMPGGDPLEVHIADSSGNDLTSTNGSLNVYVQNQATVVTTVIPISTYNEVTNVSPGMETVVVSFSVPLDGTTYLQIIEASGTNIAEFRIYVGSGIINKKYTYYTGFNTQFNFNTEIATAPGIKLNSGDILQLRAIQRGTDICNFNGRIQLIQVTSA